MNTTRRAQRKLRRRRVRARVIGSATKPRLSVFRSLNHLYAQIIDDAAGKTLLSASTKELTTKAKKVDRASEVGKLIAEKAVKAGIKEVVFDRGGYKYHGRIKSLADGAREGGLKF